MVRLLVKERRLAIIEQVVRTGHHQRNTAVLGWKIRRVLRLRSVTSERGKIFPPIRKLIVDSFADDGTSWTPSVRYSGSR